MQFLSGVSK